MSSRRNPFASSRFSRALLALGLATVVLGSLAGCHKVVSDPQDPRFIVAEVPKGWSITRAELTQQVDLVLQQQHATREQIGPAKMPILESRVLQGMVLKKLLLERAAQLSLPPADIDKEVTMLEGQVKGHFPTEQDFDKQLKTAGLTEADFRQRIREDVLIRHTLKVDAIHDAEPSDQEINDFYLKNQDKFVVPNKVRASRIVVLVDDKTSPADRAARKKAIDRAHARVVKGEDFGKVATEMSEDRYSAPKGGDVGYFQKGENEQGFDDVAFSTPQGVVSPVFETPMGYQFIKVTDVQKGGTLAVAQVRDLIARHLREQKEAEEEQAYTQSLPAKDGVIFHLVQVDLPPTGGANAPAAPAATNEEASPGNPPGAPTPTGR
jgi:peptidyl-prolyl cis-trans isomerase C